MRTICVIVVKEETSYSVIREIEERFICFTQIKELSDNLIEFEVLCRQEDASSIEARLALIV